MALPTVLAPNVLEEMLKPYPTEIQLKFREALERLHLVNPDDPIFELMLVLGLWATYYQKISGNVAEIGQKIARQNADASRSLNERVRMLQGLAQTIQQATDRLSDAGQEIVARFPIEAIAQ